MTDDDTAPVADDGRHDFDFLHGRWTVHNSRLAVPQDRHCRDWVDTEATVEVRPILAGLGNVDTFSFAAGPAGPAFEAVTLRLFDPGPRRWSIRWASTRHPGRLDPPVEGAFDGSRGRFEGDDVVGEEAVRVRFDWLADADAPRWEQSFRWSGEDVWRPNWVMNLARRP